MENQPKPKRGAPYGNKNAFKHGFYSRALSPFEKKGLQHAASIQGVDQEIVLLRLKLRSALVDDPRNFKVIEQALLTLNRLMRTQSKLAKQMSYGETLQRAIENVLREVAVPLGVDLTELSAGRHTLIGPVADTPGSRQR